MSDNLFIAVVIIEFVLIAIIYAKMILIHRDVQMQIHERIVSDFNEVNKLYLRILSKCGEKPTENVTYKEMHERIKYYLKNEL